MKQPSTVLPPPVTSRMPLLPAPLPLMTRPRTVEPPPVIFSASAAATLNFSSTSSTALSPVTSVFALAPGCV